MLQLCSDVGLMPLCNVLRPPSQQLDCKKQVECACCSVCRWAESELLDTLMRLEIGLAGRVEAWKATRWAAKLEQLKCKNDSLVRRQRHLLLLPALREMLHTAPVPAQLQSIATWVSSHHQVWPI